MKDTLHQSTQHKMNRQQFFLLLGKRLAGFYFLVLGIVSLKSLLPKQQSKTQTSLKSNIKVSAHPMAVQRNKRG